MLNFNQYRILAAAHRWRRPRVIYEKADIPLGKGSAPTPYIYQLHEKGFLDRGVVGDQTKDGGGRHARYYKVSKEGILQLEEFYEACEEILDAPALWRDA